MSDYLPFAGLKDPVETQALIGARGVECHICLGPHDEEIHEATLSVRRWFREEVTQGFHKLEILEPPGEI
jgi:hypothetical protein